MWLPQSVPLIGEGHRLVCDSTILTASPGLSLPEEGVSVFFALASASPHPTTGQGSQYMFMSEGIPTVFLRKCHLSLMGVWLILGVNLIYMEKAILNDELPPSDCLWACLWDTGLMDALMGRHPAHCEQCQPLTEHEQGKEASKWHSSWALLQFLPPGSCLSSVPGFSPGWTPTCKM